jgi:hypothetical protein
MCVCVHVHLSVCRCIYLYVCVCVCVGEYTNQSECVSRSVMVEYALRLYACGAALPRSNLCFCSPCGVHSLECHVMRSHTCRRYCAHTQQDHSSSLPYCVWLLGMFALEYCFLDFQDHRYQLAGRRGALENIHDLIGVIGTRLEGCLRKGSSSYQRVDLSIICRHFQQGRVVLLLAALNQQTPLLRTAVSNQLKEYV